MDHLEELRKKYFKNPYNDKFCDYKGCLIRPGFYAMQDKIYNMDVREDDVWVSSFPKSGKLLRFHVSRCNISITEMCWPILDGILS